MKKITLLLIAIFTFSLTFGQNAWTRSDDSKVDMLEKVNRSSFPTTYKLFQLDLVKFKQQLEGAPVRGAFSGRSKQIISLPNEEGIIERFYVMETPIMEAELARKFPMIKSYAAQGVDNPGSVARFSVTQFGLHNITFTPGKSTLYIDPYTSDLATYIVYERSALSETAQDFECLTAEDVALPSLERNTLDESRANATDDSKLRTYRLALSCTGEYGALFAGTGTIQQKKANIQARMAITMTRVNGVYERDLAITMIFVANNDLIIYFNASNDPWTGEYNTKTAQTIDAAIGLANYDIGHNFNTSGGGNAGCIGCVCSTTSSPNSSTHKGRGYTGRSNPTGDAFDIDYVAHEMGHQFGGYHTQSNSSCFSGSGLTEVEPGSASTIMGYAGICAPNVQNRSDDYFHYVNIRDITNNIKSGVSSSCAQITTFTNTAPVISPLQNYIIPISTPFVLTGSATDADGDALNYTWEQNDPENSNQANSAGPGQFETSGPLFRSERGTVSPSRFFPKKATILTGQLATTWEVLPAVGRVMNFALTVRDNVSGGGQTATGEMKVTVSNVAGPFSITSQNAAVSYPGGSNQIITWDVASTNLAPVNTRFVDIYMSTNNGTTFPILLASQVPNDGSETVTIPNLVGNTNRIMVQGHDNIFFDISNANFTITDAQSTFSVAFSGVAGEQNKSVCKGGSLTYTLPYQTYGGFSGTTTFTAANLPAGISVSFNPTSVTSNTDVVVTVNSSTEVVAQLYAINVLAVSGGTTKDMNFYANISDNAFTEINLTAPTNAAVLTPDEVVFNWTASNGATNYDIQIATDSNFNTIIETATVATNSYKSTTLESLQSYFRRVQPKNDGCSAAFSSALTFSTTFCGFAESLNVPIGISVQPSTITSTITVDALDSVTINDVKVKLDISHSWISDLTVNLTSPNGTVIQLFSNKCGSRDNIVATFDDAGTAIFCGTNPAISGNILPAQPLAGFSGQTSQGVWTLTVSDLTNGDGGVLNSWGINFCSPTPPLDVVKNELSELMVYPNPNSGNFNVKFKNTTSDKVELNVYDLSGRVIFVKNYFTEGDFNENIQLNAVQAGVYLLSISDGGQKEVQRIIVK